MTKLHPKRFLVSPLEWGLGHATRLSAIVDILLRNNHEVILVADGLPYHFLAEKFPDLPIERLPLKTIRYSRKRNGFFFKLALQIPGFLWSVKKTKRAINDLVDKYQPDCLIADNRYGFCHPGVPSIFITHQLRPMPPKHLRWLQSLVGRLHLMALRKFDQIWVADYAREGVAGKLSTIPWTNKKIRYIGPVSWLKHQAQPLANSTPEYDLLVMLSGPEPHRSILEKKLLHLLGDLPDTRILILRGLPGNTQIPPEVMRKGSIRMVNHLSGSDIARYILTTPKIICRAGVVTIFDLAVLQRPALLIPTAGQTEQEYVANDLSHRGYVQTIAEKDLDITAIKNFDPASCRIFPDTDAHQTESVIIRLLQPAQNPADA